MSRRIAIVVLLACLAVSLVCVLYPFYVIRPFRAQGAQELAIALALLGIVRPRLQDGDAPGRL